MKKATKILAQYAEYIKPEVLKAISRPMLEAVAKRNLGGIFIKDIELGDDEAIELDRFFRRFISGEPLGKIVGKSNFYGYDFRVTRDVLDPRSDSECMIDAVLGRVSGRENIKVLDLGVGTGCLLITLLAQLKSAYGIGVDISSAALEVARENADRNRVVDRVEFIISDWLDLVPSQVFDVVVSNPPYIRTNDIPRLEIGVRAFDPMIALDGGGDGLDCYRLIFSKIKPFINEKSYFFVEIGYEQLYDAQKIAWRNGLSVTNVYNDMSGVPRILELVLSV